MAATQDISSRQPARCYLLELPGELGNKIYTLALTRSKPVAIAIQARYSKNKDLTAHAHVNSCEVLLPPLLKLSYDIKSEAHSICISSNCFRFVLESCFYCHGGFYSFDFDTCVPNLLHLTQFEICSNLGVVFAIDIGHGLGIRYVRWIVPDESMRCTTSRHTEEKGYSVRQGLCQSRGGD
jgi:hypothetical protein